MASRDEREIANELLRSQYINLKRRGVSDTDPEMKGIKRMIEQQKIGVPKEGKDFPSRIKFTPPRRQNGQS